LQSWNLFPNLGRIGGCVSFKYIIMHAVIIGASGLTGSSLTTQLLENNQVDKVLLLVRKALSMQHPKLQQQVVDFSNLDQLKQFVQGDVLFCCIGTTIKIAGSKEAFTKVDYDIPVHCAQAAFANGVKKVVLISSVGASSASSNFYLQTKGKVEDTLQALSFSATHIFQPSFLMGDRKESRLGEKIASAIFSGLSFLLFGGFKKYRPIHIQELSNAMMLVGLSDSKGVHVHRWEEIKKVVANSYSSTNEK
jgi:uncharacterized protein YbjT (DUF2867 family)